MTRRVVAAARAIPPPCGFRPVRGDDLEVGCIELAGDLVRGVGRAELTADIVRALAARSQARRSRDRRSRRLRGPRRRRHPSRTKHHWRGPCVLTIGDVEVDGQREYGTAYPQLRQEMRGERRGTSETYPCHVWLTFADMHVVDVTFFPYRYYDRVPSPWQWSHHVLCSDPRHTLAADLPPRYVPMLVGLNAVKALIA